MPNTASKSHESKGAAASSSNGYDDDDDEDNSDDTDDDNSVGKYLNFQDFDISMTPVKGKFSKNKQLSIITH